MSSFLLWASVKPATQARYRAALKEFKDWVTTADHPINMRTASSIDKALSQFAHYLYLVKPSRGNRQLVINARCALNIIYPHTVGRLPSADRAIKGWNNLVPSSTKAPVSYGFCLFLAQALLRNGETEAAYFCILAFDTFCRARELLSLTRDDVTLPTGNLPGGLRLRDTKTGRNQSVTIRHPLAVAVLRKLIAAAPTGSSPLFSITYPALLSTLKARQSRLGIPPQKAVTPHCFRHGGASFWFIMSVPILDIVVRGRWANEKSAKSYIQSGAALIFGDHLPRKIQILSDQLARKPLVLLHFFPPPTATLPSDFLPQPYAC